MAVRIRLTRVGNRNNPFYRIVVANQSSPNNGKVIERLGTYDPKGGGKAVLKRERYDYWVGEGAIPTDTVKSLVPRAVDHASTRPAAQEAAAPAEEAEAETAETAETAEAAETKEAPETASAE